MQNFPRSFQALWQTPDPAGPSPVLVMDMTDMGANEGIDVVVHVGASGGVVFEAVLAEPESTMLLTSGSVETEAFWQCMRSHIRIHGARQLFLTARCRSSPLAIAVSSLRVGYAERRNVRFLRLVEDILDEFRTREPGLSVGVAVTHRNPEIDRCLNY